MKYSIYTDEINPFLRFFCKRNVPLPTQLGYARDARIFYFYSGGEVMHINGKTLHLNKNDAVLVNSMNGYYFENDDNRVEHSYSIINFDFLFGNNNIKAPLQISRDCTDRPIQSVTFTDIKQEDGYIVVNVPEIEINLESINKVFGEKRAFYSVRCNAQLTLILARIFEKFFNGTEEGLPYAVLKYIKNNYQRNLTNRDIGEQFHYHPNYINRLFVEHFGVSLHRYVVNYRVEMAIILLSSGNLTLGEVAAKTGFSDAGYFSKVFYEVTGHKPNKYRII